MGITRGKQPLGIEIGKVHKTMDATALVFRDATSSLDDLIARVQENPLHLTLADVTIEEPGHPIEGENWRPQLAPYKPWVHDAALDETEELDGTDGDLLIVGALGMGITDEERMGIIGSAVRGEEGEGPTASAVGQAIGEVVAGTGAAAAAAPVDAGRRRAVKRRTKRAVMDRMGYDEVARISAYIDPALARSELRPAVEAALNIEEPTDLATPERETIIDEILDDVVGLGPLQPLIEDDTVTEIMINGCRSAFFERGGVLYPIEHAFEDDEQIRVLIDRIISPLGRRIDERSPIVNARLKTGYRVNAVIPPVAIDGPILTIRKFSDRICSLDELVGLGSLPLWYAQLLSCAVSLRQDLAVAGGTGSGKTTLLNALSCEISTGERIVTIEDSAELKFAHHPHVVRLEAREASIEGEGAVTIRDLVTNALRMRPDRIVVGEVRGAECCDMLQAMNTGHDGSLTTLHAGSEQETVVRLTLLARYGIDLPSELIEEQIAMALDGIVMSERHADGRRFVSSYSGVRRAASGGVELERYVTFDAAERTWKLDREPPFIAEGLRSGTLTQEEVDEWRSLCPSS